MSNERRYPPLGRFHKPMIAFLRFLVRTLAKVHLEGLENVPEEGGTILVINHLHHLDSPALGCFIPRDMWAFAGEKYEKHIFSLVLNQAGAIYVQRGEVDRRSLRQALNVLEDGHMLGVAPEGTRSKTGAMAEAKTGAAYLATRSGAMLLPGAVWGTENIIPAWTKLRRADIYVHIGKTFTLPEGRARTPELETYTDEIMTTIAALLPEKYRGVYADHPLLNEKLKALSDQSQQPV